MPKRHHVSAPRVPRRRSNQRGFTLVELAIVIAIIGLVSSFALPAVQDARKRADETAAIGMIRALHAAQTTYKQQGHPSEPRLRGYARDVRGLEEVGLAPAALRPDDIWADVRQHRGYRVYTFGGYTDHSSAFGRRMFAVAFPIALGRSGDHSYLMTEEGRIYYRAGNFFFDPVLGNPLQ